MIDIKHNHHHDTVVEEITMAGYIIGYLKVVNTTLNISGCYSSIS
ncbi:hypothetical protein [Photobacterium iliopiscarium]|nr:hypothetical protein [Photobacterium iliopiscarium]